jgi:primosomal protein N'
MLVPEIALTPAWPASSIIASANAWRFCTPRFHDSERGQEWRRIRAGHAQVRRSRLAPVSSHPCEISDLIVVDEEHDKQLQAAGDAALITDAMWLSSARATPAP